MIKGRRSHSKGEKLMSLFDRAKQIGLQHIREWLPDGRDDGGEWTAINPTREDKTAGSFKVNLASGCWFENATSESGGDAVSLYAYLNASQCTTAAQQKGYHNLLGGMQAEAARAILEAYDSSYFPGSEDDFTPAKHTDTKSNYWDGWSPVKHKVEPLPELDTSFHEKQWGKPVERWTFSDAKRTVMIVVRFLDGTKKADRPFTLWCKGTEYRWRSKAPDEAYPLWNLQELILRPTDAVILCEGQKAASRGQAAIKDYVFTGWYGGAGSTAKSDWSPLRGRTVYFWPDSDNPGRKAIKALREIEQTYDISLTVIHPPVGVPKGWDLADALEEGKNIADIIAGDKKPATGEFLDDIELPFDIVGTSGSDIIFYPHGSNRIERYRASALTKNALMTLADRSVWGTYYAKEDGGIAWDSAINDVIRRSEKVPVFQFSRVRGAGAWLEGSQVVVNTGEYLLVDGERRQLHESDGEYVYEKKAFVPYRATDAMKTSDSARLLDIIKHIEWVHPSAAYALAGWLLLSPWGGVLRWRPHIWIVGPKGTGKSWVLENVVFPMSAKEFGEKGDGTSTPAGVRQVLANSSKCFIGDEMESDNMKFAESIEQILKLFRGSSSGSESGGATLHGSADGEGKHWVVQSMACFASIGAAMAHGADMDRFTVLELKPPVKGMIDMRKQNFAKLESLAVVLTTEWSRAFHARTYNLSGELLKAIAIMSEQTGKIVGTMRDGDQIGTLMAGAWMVDHDKAPTASEAKEWLTGLQVADLKANVADKSDEEQCLDEILSVKVEIANKEGRSKMTVGSALELWYGQESGLHGYESQRDDYPGITQAGISRELEQIGIKPVITKGVQYLYIAIGHPSLRRSIKESGWANSYSSLLARLPFCENANAGPTRFAGLQRRFIKLKQETSDAVPF